MHSIGLVGIENVKKKWNKNVINGCLLYEHNGAADLGVEIFISQSEAIQITQ